MAPIKWVLHWQTNPEAPLTHILPEACACVESLPGAVREGRWRSVLTNYRPVPVPILHRDQVVTAIAQHELLPRDILGLSFDNHPTEYYFVTRSQRLVVKADFSVQNIMEKLGSYRPQFVNRFEGFEYKFGDFRLRIGKCLNIPNQKLRGIVMEVEYMPLSSVVKSKRVMEDFVDMWQDAIGSKYLAGRFTVSGVNFSQYGLGDHYTPQHTAVQYATTILHINAYTAGLRVMHWHPNPGTMLTTQVVSEACACAESLPGIIREGRWRSVMTFYKPISQRDTPVNVHPPDLPRDLLGLSFHELPNEYFFVMRTQKLTMRADLSIQNVMDKLGSYKARFIVNFEGLQYKLGDFRLRIGKCINTPNDALRGIMMEVEYLPLSSIETSRRIMEEFFDIWQEAIVKKSLAGHFINPEANFTEYGLGDHYTPQHTAVQYGICIFQVMASNRTQ